MLINKVLVRGREASYHIEGDDILERDQASLELLYKRLVNADGTGAGWEAQDKGTSWGRRGRGDAIDDVVGHIGAGAFSVVANDEPHFGGWVRLNGRETKGRKSDAMRKKE